MKLRLFYVLLMLAGTLSSGLLQAQTQAFEAGYQAYMRNQFPVAEAHFKRALTATKTREDRAFILKFLGISQYMRGDRKQAANTFYQAFMNDPRTSIYLEEVLDPSVVEFYNSLKTRWVQQAQARQKQLEQQRSTVRDQAPPLPSSRQQMSQEPGRTPDRRQQARTARHRQPSRADESRKKSSRDISWLHFMPFGAGQFYNGQYIWGGLYLGAQVFSVGLYLQRDQQIRTDTKSKNDFLDEPTGSEADQNQYLEDLDDRINLLEREAENALIGFGLSYGISILHGIISAPRQGEKSMGSLSPTGLELAKHERLDHWYQSHPAPRSQLAIYPGSNGSWLVRMNLHLH